MRRTSVLGGIIGSFLGFAIWSSPAQAQEITGLITMAAGDPQDFVVALDKDGPCGSRFFHMQRTNTNFKEMVAVELTAFATGKFITLFVTGCGGNRNIISHGYARR